MNSLFLILNKIAISAMQRSEIVGAAFALALVFMLIIPLPLPLIDTLIALNICLSSLLIVLAMYLPKPLAFSTFPAVLLLTTMFRPGTVYFGHAPDSDPAGRRAYCRGVRQLRGRRQPRRWEW